MPFTPFHFGPSALVALPFRGRADLPAFLLSNIVIDIEPLTVMLFRLHYPLHGYAHTIAFGLIAGVITMVLVKVFRGIIGPVMNYAGLAYSPSLFTTFIWGVAGAWFHVILDAPLYYDIRPFWPIEANPLFGLVSNGWVYIVCSVSFIPAVAAYILVRNRRLSKTA